MHRRLIAATTLCATLLLAACTQQAPQPPPPPPSGPKMPSDPPPSSAPQSASPSPNAQEHADLLEIQSLYKAQFAEQIRVLKEGGADQLPADMRKRTTGIYQRDVLESFRESKKTGRRMTVGGKLLGIAMDTWTPSKVTFHSCEDYSGVESVDKYGHPITGKPGVRTIQKFTVVKQDGRWLLAASDGRTVTDFQGAACNGKWYS